MVTTEVRPTTIEELIPPLVYNLPSDILARGWCQGRFKNEQGHVCLTGASWYFGSEEEGYEFRHTVREVLGDGNAITGWNDTPGRTQTEVVAVAREAERRLGWRS